MKHRLKIVPFGGFPPSKRITFMCVNEGCQHMLQFERATLSEIMAGADTLVYIGLELNRRRSCPIWIGPEPDTMRWTTVNEWKNLYG